jgi:hypothetical protein
MGTHVLNGAVYSLRYDVLKDFEPISLVSVTSGANLTEIHRFEFA